MSWNVSGLGDIFQCNSMCFVLCVYVVSVFLVLLHVQGSSKPGGAVHLKALCACALRSTADGTRCCTSEKPTSAQSECLMSHGNVSEVNIGLWYRTRGFIWQ